MLIAIFACLYVLTGLQIANAMSVSYNRDKWYNLWLVTLGWPVHVAWAMIGLIVEGFVTVHNVIFPKEEAKQ